MKTMLTASESAKLIELGVSPKRASESKYNRYYFPIFTLADILDILPKGICYEGLWIKLRITSWIDEPWFAGYQNQVGIYVTPNKAPFSAPRTHRRSLLAACVVSGERVCEIRRKRK